MTGTLVDGAPPDAPLSSDRPHRPARRPDGPARVARAAALVVPTVLLLLQGLRLRQWLVDDALISVAYARTLSEGGGLAQSLGDPPVEGVSNPTWTLLLAGARLLGLSDHGRSLGGVTDTVWTVRVLGLVCFVATLLCLRAAAPALLPAAGLADVAVGVAGLVLVASPNYVIWTFSGLENPLYGLLAAALAAHLARAATRARLLRPGTAAGSAGLVLLLAATRPDGLVFAAAHPLLVALLLVRRPRPAGPAVLRGAATYAVALGLPLAALLLWRHATFGLWVPNTAVAKGQHLDLAAVPSRLHDLVLAAGTWLVVASAVALVVALRADRAADRSGDRPSDGGRLRAWAGLLVPFGLACTAFTLLDRDWMGEYRFATPAAVLGAGLLGVASARCLGLPSGRRTRLALVTVLVAVLVAGTVAVAPRLTAFTRSPIEPGCFVVERFGRSVDGYGDALGIRTGTYLVPDIGGVLLVSRFQVVDLAGLTDPVIARFRSTGDTAGLRDYVLSDLRPTFVHVHGSWDPGLREDPRFRRDYLAILPGADYVRRDATTPAAVSALRPLAERWVAQVDETRRADPEAGCSLTAG